MFHPQFPFQVENTKVSDLIESENTLIIHVFPPFLIFKITDILDKPFNILLLVPECHEVVSNMKQEWL